MKNPYDYYTIQVHKQDQYNDGICQVTRRTPGLWRLVDTFGHYMMREMHHDSTPFDVDSTGEGTAVYLFGEGGAWIGACEFTNTAFSPGGLSLTILGFLTGSGYTRMRGTADFSQRHGRRLRRNMASFCCARPYHLRCDAL